MDIQDLYNEKVKLTIKFIETENIFTVDMINEASRYGDKLKQDCKISSWAENRFFRTTKGEFDNDDRYKTIGGLKRSIRTASKKRGLTVDEFIFSKQ